MESYTANANNFARKIAALSKEAMTQKRNEADPNVPHYHSERPRLSGMAF